MDCKHRGDYEHQVPCSKSFIPGFECELHKICTVQRPSVDPEVKWCMNCEDREPPK